jgi:hypothetical protein
MCLSPGSPVMKLSKRSGEEIGSHTVLLAEGRAKENRIRRNERADKPRKFSARTNDALGTLQ